MNSFYIFSWHFIHSEIQKLKHLWNHIKKFQNISIALTEINPETNESYYVSIYRDFKESIKKLKFLQSRRERIFNAIDRFYIPATDYEWDHDIESSRCVYHHMPCRDYRYDEISFHICTSHMHNGIEIFFPDGHDRYVKFIV
jgi:hypothetical protein